MKERERERERREDTPVLSRMIDRSGGVVVYFMQQGLTRRARRHERDASTPTYPGRFRSSVERGIIFMQTMILSRYSL